MVQIGCREVAERLQGGCRGVARKVQGGCRRDARRMQREEVLCRRREVA